MMAFLKRLVGVRALPERLSYEDARAVLELRERAAQQELAARADAEPEILYYLAGNGDEPTRRAVAANPATPAKADRLLAEDVDPSVRSELARKIGRLLPDLLASERERVCELTLETLQKLADDQTPRVRTILAARDRAASIACRRTSSSSWRATPSRRFASRFWNIRRCSPMPICSRSSPPRGPRSALAAVARRRGVSETVSDAIVASLDIPAVAALLANPNARVREDTIERIIDHAETIEDWHGPLGDAHRPVAARASTHCRLCRRRPDRTAQRAPRSRRRNPGPSQPLPAPAARARRRETRAARRTPSAPMC